MYAIRSYYEIPKIETMLYWLFDFLEQYDIPGAGMFQYISFRAAMSVITSLLISLLIGKKIIRLLQKKLV